MALLWKCTCMCVLARARVVYLCIRARCERESVAMRATVIVHVRASSHASVYVLCLC